MSAVAVGMNLLLAGLLAAALMLGFRLNARLKALRDSHDGFAKAVAELDQAAARAEQGLADLRAATDEATDQLADRIEKARALSARLERQMQAAPPARPVRPALVRAEAEEAEEAEAVRLERLGAILSQAREARLRSEPANSPLRGAQLRRVPPVARLRPQFEDDLFDAPAAPLRAVGGRS